jgi:hypothetical protein
MRMRARCQIGRRAAIIRASIHWTRDAIERYECFYI